MAMSQRAGAYNSAIAAASNRGRPQRSRQSLPATRSIYDDFRPVSEWKTENEALILLLRLPGFSKTQINYAKDYSKRSVRIYGERALANNRRIRFNTTFTIPQNCDFNQITTHFDHGVFKITIPKLYNLTTTPDIPQQNEEAIASQEKPTTKPEKSDEEPITFGTKTQEKAVVRKTLPEKGSTATGANDETEAGKENLELKNEKDSGDKKKTQDQEMLIAGKLAIVEKNKSDDDGNEKNKEKNEVKKERRTETENIEKAMKEVESSEERQLVVNMCVAVMVIVGLSLDLFTKLVA